MQQRIIQDFPKGWSNKVVMGQGSSANGMPGNMSHLPARSKNTAMAKSCAKTKVKTCDILLEEDSVWLFSIKVLANYNQKKKKTFDNT